MPSREASSITSAAAPLRVAIVLLPRFSMHALTASIEPMRVANYLASQELYRWDLRATQAGPLPASNGLELNCKGLEGNGLEEPDIIAVCGSWGSEHHDSRALKNWLRRQERAGRLLIGIELGVYPLARAGLLDGRRAALHWSWKPGFVEQFPDIEVSEQLFTIDRTIMTCAGGTAVLDFMLQVVARQHGDLLAAEVANQMLYYPCRPAEAAQRQILSSLDRQLHPTVEAAIRLIEARIDEPLPVPELCRELKVSQRQLERLFRRDVGCSVVQLSQLIRLQYARVLLTSTKLSVREVSVACGFSSMSYFSLSFSRRFGKRPSEYRQTWPQHEPRPSWPGTVYSLISESKALAARGRTGPVSS